MRRFRTHWLEPRLGLDAPVRQHSASAELWLRYSVSCHEITPQTPFTNVTMWETDKSALMMAGLVQVLHKWSTRRRRPSPAAVVRSWSKLLGKSTASAKKLQFEWHVSIVTFITWGIYSVINEKGIFT